MAVSSSDIDKQITDAEYYFAQAKGVADSAGKAVADAEEALKAVKYNKDKVGGEMAERLKTIMADSYTDLEKKIANIEYYLKQVKDSQYYSGQGITAAESALATAKYNKEKADSDAAGLESKISGLKTELDAAKRSEEEAEKNRLAEEERKRVEQEEQQRQAAEEESARQQEEARKRQEAEAAAAAETPAE